MLCLILAVAAFTEIPVINCVSQEQARIRATIHAVEHDARIVSTTGPSMLPRIGQSAILLVRDLPYSEITPRSIVLKRDPKNAKFISCHRVVGRRGSEWVTKGDSNTRLDPVFLNAANYCGTAILIFNYPP